MFVDKLESRFGLNTPIFADEIVEYFGEYTRAYVFRLIKKAGQAGELVSYSRGVYYIPRTGINLLNQFGITTQVPNILEIVTNNETTRKRNVVIAGKEFIIRKARCEINAFNYLEYTLMQLFNDMNTKDRLDDFAKAQINSYIRKNNITMEKLLAMSAFFPSLIVKKMIGSGVLNGVF